MDVRSRGTTGMRLLAAAAAVFAFPVVVLVAYGASVLVASESLGALWWAVFLVPAALYGAVVARAWALALPLAWAAAILGVLRLADLISGACSVCGPEDDWSSVTVTYLFFAVLPLTFAVAAGVLVGITWRDRRDRPTPSASASAGSA